MKGFIRFCPFTYYTQTDGAMTVRKMNTLLIIVTVFAHWQYAKAADCPDAIKPTNSITGCQWNETVDANKCKTFTISCGSDSKIDKGCLLDSDNGPCFAHITKYYYNTRVGKCSPFVFGGCSANANNFNTQDECTSVCIDGKPRKTPDVSFASSNTGNQSLNCTGVNEQYYGCGACDSNCNSTTKAVCSLICRTAECGCIDGYVRNSDDVCVAPDKCKEPSKPTNLDPNAGSESVNAVKPAVLSTILTTVKPTVLPTTLATVLSTTANPTTVVVTIQKTTPLAVLLSQPNATLPPAFTLHPPISTVGPSLSTKIPRGQLCSLIVCPSGYNCLNGTCFSANTKCDKLKLALAPTGCKHAFRNDSNGCAIPYLLCNNITCGQNEEAKLCGACDGTCGSPVCIPAEQCLTPSCGCFSGYVRSKANKCVPKTECSGSTTKKPEKNVDTTKNLSVTPVHTAFTLPQIVASTTPAFYAFHNNVINSIYTGPGPARMTPN